MLTMVCIVGWILRPVQVGGFPAFIWPPLYLHADQSPACTSSCDAIGTTQLAAIDGESKPLRCIHRANSRNALGLNFHHIGPRKIANKPLHGGTELADMPSGPKA